MIAMSLSQAADALEGHRHGDDDRFCGVSTDSRTVAAGELFFALRGPHFDGHDMLVEVAQAGAAAAVVEHTVTQPPCRITVRNTRAGLGRLASMWRRQFNIPMIGVTGSAGKTTVKEMLGAIMRERGPTLVTHGNLNNDIGVPLTLFGLGAEHKAAVIEMGASRRGDIAALSAIARPTIGLITLCAPAHLEGFGDVDTVARTKGEIVAGLDRDGVAVINNEDAFAPLWRELAGSRRIISFGDGGEVSARSVVSGGAETRFRLCCAAGEIDVALACKGRHNVLNAMAAAAAALAADATLEQISRGLAVVRPLTGRLMPRAGIGGARLYDDSYNANPASLSAALAVLGCEDGAKWLVFGDMGELGAQARVLHERAGKVAAEAGVERLFTIGGLAQYAHAEFGRGATHYDNQSDLIEALKADLGPLSAADNRTH